MLRRTLLSLALPALTVVLLSNMAPFPAAAQEASPANDYGKKLPSPPAQAQASLDGKMVTIDYGAPSMRGRKIFGGLLSYGKVWRTGANPATSLKTEVNLKIGDLSVPAGSYTIYSVPSETTWKLIVNKQTGQWGTVYNQDQDLGRTDMQRGPAPTSPVERFVIKFEKTHFGQAVRTSFDLG